MPSLTVELKHDSPKSRRILQAVSSRIKASRDAYQKRHEAWRKAEETALAYLPEDEITRKKRVERDYYGEPELTRIRIPYSYGVLMASHTYWTTVFLSRTPVNQFAGRHGESEHQVQALEALIDYQVQVGEMMVPWYLWLLDVGKYGLGVMSINWADEYSMISSYEEVPQLWMGLLDLGETKKQKVSKRVPGYSGNQLTNIRPYDFYPDPRVPVRFFQKGEFCGVRINPGWNTIIKRTEQGYYIKETVDRLKARIAGTGHGESNWEYDVGSDQVELPMNMAFSHDSETKKGKKGSNSNIEGYECVIELVPSEWDLGRGTYPEKWVFTVTSDFTYILGAQPLGANHDKFPYVAIEYEPEGYSINARGVGEILKPINDVMDWLINSHLFNVRKALNDQFVVDPSQVVLSDLENPLPGGAIRMSPAAYGKDSRTVMTQLPVQDVTRTHLTDMAQMLNIGQRTIGVNDSLMGQINPTGRRSATEVRTGTGFGINRLKTTSEFFSAMGWTPMAQQIVSNSQQYYDGAKKFRIVGQLAQEAGEEFMNVTPEDILGYYDFVPIDGTLPADRQAQATLWTNLMGQLRNYPDIMMRYDMGRIFEWVAQLAGLKNIRQFRVDIVPDEQLMAQAQQGNVVPLGGGGQAMPQSGNTPPLQTQGPDHLLQHPNEA